VFAPEDTRPSLCFGGLGYERVGEGVYDVGVVNTGRLVTRRGICRDRRGMNGWFWVRVLVFVLWRAKGGEVGGSVLWGRWAGGFEVLIYRVWLLPIPSKLPPWSSRCPSSLPPLTSLCSEAGPSLIYLWYDRESSYHILDRFFKVNLWHNPVCMSQLILCNRCMEISYERIDSTQMSLIKKILPGVEICAAA